MVNCTSQTANCTFQTANIWQYQIFCLFLHPETKIKDTQNVCNMKHIGFFAIIMLLATIFSSSCNRHKRDKQDAHEVHTAIAQDTDRLILDYKRIVKDESYSSFYKKTLKDGNFNDFFIAQDIGGYVFLIYESAKDKCHRIDFYDEYTNAGLPRIKGFPSPDGKYVYVIGNIMANSTGWINTFIVYQVNTSTFKVEYINAVAAWKLEKDGFTVASQTRCTTPEATCSAEMDFAFEDITYGFDGKIKHRSREYPSKEIKRKYKNSKRGEVY